MYYDDVYWYVSCLQLQFSFLVTENVRISFSFPIRYIECDGPFNAWACPWRFLLSRCTRSSNDAFCASQMNAIRIASNAAETYHHQPTSFQCLACFMPSALGRIFTARPSPVPCHTHTHFHCTLFGELRKCMQLCTLFVFRTPPKLLYYDG